MLIDQAEVEFFEALKVLQPASPEKGLRVSCLKVLRL
jgi:hypothetical protein